MPEESINPIPLVPAEISRFRVPFSVVGDLYSVIGSISEKTWRFDDCSPSFWNGDSKFEFFLIFSINWHFEKKAIIHIIIIYEVRGRKTRFQTI